MCIFYLPLEINGIKFNIWWKIKEEWLCFIEMVNFYFTKLKKKLYWVSEEHVLILLPHLVLIIKPCQTNTQCYRSKQTRSASKRSIEGKNRYLTKLLTWKVSAGYEHFSLFQRWGNKQAASLFEAWQTHSNNKNNNPLTLILPLTLSLKIYKKILEIFLPDEFKLTHL